MEDQDKSLKAINAAYSRISDMIVQTPLMESKWLSHENDCHVRLKLESEQTTGSFKLRGAVNKIKILLETSKERLCNESLVTASSGNHALGCAYASSKLGIGMRIYSYLDMAKTKEEMLSVYPNVQLLKYGDNCCAAEVHARSEANKDNLIFVSPYNDLDIIQGQATISVEMLKQMEDIDFVFVPVGGGGLISGIAMYIKIVNPKIQIVACQPVNDCCMYESIKAGHIVEDNAFSDTISSGTAGRIEPGSITFEIIQQCVDQWVLLEEEEIELAVYDMIANHNKIIEGAAGLTIAGLRKMKDKVQGKNVALVICGANLGLEHMNHLLQKYGV